MLRDLILDKSDNWAEIWFVGWLSVYFADRVLINCKFGFMGWSLLCFIYIVFFVFVISEYLDEAMMVPKNTSVLIRRVPGRPRMNIVTQQDEYISNFYKFLNMKIVFWMYCFLFLQSLYEIDSEDLVEFSMFFYFRPMVEFKPAEPEPAKSSYSGVDSAAMKYVSSFVFRTLL